jgi:hypothetical protein
VRVAEPMNHGYTPIEFFFKTHAKLHNSRVDMVVATGLEFLPRKT